MQKAKLKFLDTVDTSLNVETLLRVEHFVSLKENVLVEMMPGAGKSRFCGLFTQIHYPQRKFLLLDQRLDFQTCKDIIDSQIQMLYQVKSLQEALGAMQAQADVLYLVVDNFNFENSDILNYYNYLRNVSWGKIKFILTADCSVTFHTPSNIKSEYGFLLSNIIRSVYLTPKTAQDYLKVCVEELEAKFSDSKFNIYNVCGGVPYLIKSFVRINKKYEDPQITLASEDWRLRLEDFWERFDASERQILKTYAYTGKLPEKSGVVQYLLETGTIQLEHPCPSWIRIASGQKADGQFSLEEGQIFWDGVDFGAQFTKVESALLKTLIEKQNQIISKEEIAEKIWGKNVDLKYSIGALDKTISRLRKRFQELELPVDRIVTQKGLGIKLTALANPNPPITAR